MPRNSSDHVVEGEQGVITTPPDSTSGEPLLECSEISSEEQPSSDTERDSSGTEEGYDAEKLTSECGALIIQIIEKASMHREIFRILVGSIRQEGSMSWQEKKGLLDFLDSLCGKLEFSLLDAVLGMESGPVPIGQCDKLLRTLSEIHSLLAARNRDVLHLFSEELQYQLRSWERSLGTTIERTTNLLSDITAKDALLQQSTQRDGESSSEIDHSGSQGAEPVTPEAVELYRLLFLTINRHVASATCYMKRVLDSIVLTESDEQIIQSAVEIKILESAVSALQMSDRLLSTHEEAIRYLYVLNILLKKPLGAREKELKASVPKTLNLCNSLLEEQRSEVLTQTRLNHIGDAITSLEEAQTLLEERVFEGREEEKTEKHSRNPFTAAFRFLANLFRRIWNFCRDLPSRRHSPQQDLDDTYVVIENENVTLTSFTSLNPDSQDFGVHSTTKARPTLLPPETSDTIIDIASVEQHSLGSPRTRSSMVPQV